MAKREQLTVSDIFEMNLNSFFQKAANFAAVFHSQKASHYSSSSVAVAATVQASSNIKCTFKNINNYAIE